MSQNYRQLIDEVEQVILYLIATNKLTESQRIQWEEVKERTKTLPMDDVWVIYSNFASQLQDIDFDKLSRHITSTYDKIRDYYTRENELTPEQLQSLQNIKAKYDIENSNPEKELKELEEFFNYVTLNQKKQKEELHIKSTQEAEEQVKNYFKAFNYLRGVGKIGNKAYSILSEIVSRNKEANTLYTQECLKELQDFYYSYNFPSVESILQKVRSQFSLKSKK